MAKFNIEAVIKKHTTDGKVDYTKVNEELQADTNAIVAKNTPDKDKLKAEARDSVAKEVIEGLGIKGVDSKDSLQIWKDNMSGSNDENKQRLNNLETENKTNLETIKLLNISKTELSDLKRSTKFSKVNDEFARGGIIKSLESQVTEEKNFDTLADEFIADDKNAHYFGEKKALKVDLLNNPNGNSVDLESDEVKKWRQQAGLEN